MLPGLHQRFVVESPATVEEIVEALLFHTQASFPLGLSGKHKEFYGTISRQGFEVRPSIAKIVKPIVRGQFERLPAGTHIESTIAVFWPEFALTLAGSLVPVMFVSLVILRTGGIWQFSAALGLISLVIALATWAFFAAEFAPEAKPVWWLMQFWFQHPLVAISPGGLHPSTLERRRRHVWRRRMWVAALVLLAITFAISRTIAPDDPRLDVWYAVLSLPAIVLVIGAELHASFPLTPHVSSPLARLALVIVGAVCIGVLIVLFVALLWVVLSA